MQDQLKKRFEDVKETWDEHPPKGHRDRFMNRLEKEQPKKGWDVHLSYRLVRRLAVAATVIIAAVFIWIYNGTSLNPSSQPSQGMTLAAISDKYHNVESFYIREVDHRLKLIENSDSDVESTIYREAIQKLSKLESDYKVLEKDLAAQSDNIRIISAMIQNYQLRIKVLENLYQKLEINQTLKLEENEKAHIHQPGSDDSAHLIT